MSSLSLRPFLIVLKVRLTKLLFFLPLLASDLTQAQESLFPNEGMKAFDITHPLLKAADSLAYIGKYEAFFDHLERFQKLPLKNHQDSLEFVYSIQEEAVSYIRIDEFQKAVNSMLRAKQLVKDWEITNNVIVAKVLETAADVYNEFDEMNKAMSAVDSALIVYHQGPYQNEDLYHAIVNCKYVVYQYVPGNTDTVFKYLEIYQDILENHSDRFGFQDPDQVWDNLFLSYGNAYSKSGDFTKAASYHLEGIRRMEARGSYNLDNYISAVFLLCVSYYYNTQYHRALPEARKLVDIVESHLSPYDYTLPQYYNLLAVNYNGVNKPDSALIWLKKCEEIDNKNNNFGLQYNTLIMNIGITLLKVKNPEAAGSELKRALKLNQAIYGKNHVTNAIFYRYLYEYSKEAESQEMALHQIDSAVQNILPGYAGGTQSSLTLESQDVAFEALDYLHLYTLQLLEAYKENPDKKEYLHTLINRALVIQKILDDKQNSMNESESILFQSSAFRAVHEAVLSALNILYTETNSQEYLDKAKGYFAASKSRLFSQELGDLRLVSNKEIPEALRSEFIMAKKRVDEIDGKLNALIEESVIHDSIKLLNGKKFEWNNRLVKAKQELRDNYGIVNSLPSPITDLNDILKSYKVTRENEAIVEYFMGEKEIILMAISQDENMFLKTPRTEEFDQKLDLFLDQLSSANNDKSLSMFTETSFYLYEKLVAPVIDASKVDIQRLVFIPDGKLNLVPFGLLIQSPADETESPKDIQYLLKDKSISYQLSLLSPQTAPSGKKAADIMAFAFDGVGVSDERAGLGGLPGAKEEVSYLKRNFKGLFRTGDKANKQEFLEKAEDYDILHLALHGKADPDNRFNSSLFFNGDSDYDLKAFDLYGLNLNPSLVVLSACESGVGANTMGEGTYSVGRGFASVGVPSVVTTLWKVNDQASAEIVQHFYANLSEGMAKDEALRQAKLSYLENTDNLLSHPYYWGSFVVMGDTSPVAIAKASSFRWYWLLAFVLVVFTISRIGRQPLSSRKS